MAECPFCGASVQEDLVMYGGPCPKCFAEIPGEEAPTDPGAEARAVQERRDRRGATLRAFVGLAAMAAVVGCTGVAALAVVLWPEPEVAVLDFDDGSFDYPEFELVGRTEAADVGEPAAVPDQPAPKVAKGPRPGKPNVDSYVPAPVAVPDGTPASAADGLRDDGVAAVDDGPRGTRGGEGAVEGPTKIDGVGGAQPTKAGFDIDAGPQVKRQGDVLTDPDQIRIMIGKAMSEQVRRLNYCYERQLKTNPTLGGRWLIRYTVSKDGRAEDASASGRDVSNGEMEACLVENIESKWTFDRINRAQPVQKTLTFRPG